MSFVKYFQSLLRKFCCWTVSVSQLKLHERLTPPCWNVEGEREVCNCACVTRPGTVTGHCEGKTGHCESGCYCHWESEH